MANELALASPLPETVRRALRMETISIFSPTDGQFEGTALGGIEIIGNPPQNDLRQALHVAGESVRPGGPVAALRSLSRLRATARQKPGEKVDMQAEAAVMGEMLAKFPADIVAMVAEKQIASAPWWPHVSELISACEREMTPRQKLVEALRKALAPKPGEMYLGEPIPETRAERLRGSVNAYLRHARPHDAARIERELAAEENRTPEDWANAAAPIDQPAKPNLPMLSEPSPEMKASLAKLSAEFHARQAPGYP